jgi:hypothetical protein
MRDTTEYKCDPMESAVFFIDASRLEVGNKLIFTTIDQREATEQLVADIDDALRSIIANLIRNDNQKQFNISMEISNTSLIASVFLCRNLDRDTSKRTS